MKMRIVCKILKVGFIVEKSLVQSYGEGSQRLLKLSKESCFVVYFQKWLKVKVFREKKGDLVFDFYLFISHFVVWEVQGLFQNMLILVKSQDLRMNNPHMSLQQPS